MLSTNTKTPVMSQTTVGFNLLLGHTDSLSLVTSRCGMLSTNTKTPVMSQTTVGFDLLQPLQILTKFILQPIGQNLRILSIFDILGSVEVVVRNLVLSRILHDGNKSFDFFIREFASTFVHIDVSFLETDVGESSSHTFDRCHGVHDLGFAVDVGVHDTQDVLELVGNY